VYNRIILEKKSKLRSFKDLLEQKLQGFNEAWHNMEKFKLDIRQNYEAIVGAMEWEPFTNIMKEYEEKVYLIQ
jgi:hypothetical protein